MVSVARAQAPTQAGVLIPVKPADLLMLAIFSACAICAMWGRSGAWEVASATFIALAVAPIVVRAAAHHWHSLTLDLFGDFCLPVVGVIVSYGHLDPVADLFHVPLADARLQSIDAALFGGQPSVMLAPHIGPLASNILMSCYSSYYLWPFLLGVLLMIYRGRDAFDRWSLTILAGIFLNYAFYMAVPAIGPRLALAGDFAAPVQGFLAGPLFRDFLHSPYQRDCFPSGHTAAALLVLFHAWRHLRPYFWAVLLPCLGLVVATIALRFHYGIDLIAAVPFSAMVYLLSEKLYAALPRGIAILSNAS